MGENAGKNVRKSLSGKYSLQPFNNTKHSVVDAFKTVSKTVIRKTASENGDLIGNKIADKTTKTSKKLRQNQSKTFINEHDKEIPKQKIWVSRRKTKHYWWSEINMIVL